MPVNLRAAVKFPQSFALIPKLGLIRSNSAQIRLSNGIISVTFKMQIIIQNPSIP